MPLVKKLIFAPVFLVVFGLLIYRFIPTIKSYDFIFSLSSNTFIGLILISTLIVLSSFLFILFASLAQDFQLTLPVSLLSALIPLLFLDPSLGLVFAVAIFVSLLITYLSLDNSLKSYLNFKPEALLGPSIRHLSGLLILAFCLVYFLSASKIIAQNGFQIPDSLIDTALKLTPLPQQTNQTENPPAGGPQLSPEQLDLLKQNPDLLRQSGLDPKILDTLATQGKNSKAPTELANNLIKQTVKDQLQGLIKPYQGFVPAALAVMLFLTLQSLTSILNLLIYPLLWITFLTLEKTGFVKFVVEQRPVKKMVV